ncbi:diacylglycerol kinase [Patescibacteria group bacterium]
MKKIKHPIGASFKAAFTGVKEVLNTERNFQIHILIAIIIVLIAFFVSVSREDIILILLIIGMVLAVEMINSGFELMFDILHPKDLRDEKQDLAVQIIKDMMAGAVLIVVIIAVIAGVLIFYPYIVDIILKT